MTSNTPSISIRGGYDRNHQLLTPNHSPQGDGMPVSTGGASSAGSSIHGGVSCERYNDLLNQHNRVLDKYTDLQKRDQSPRLLTKDPNVKKDIIRIVKQTLFKKVKFITSQQTLDDITSPGSIGRQIIAHFDVAPQDQAAFWNTYKDDVRKAFNMRRNEVQTAIQKAIRDMLEASKRHANGDDADANTENNSTLDFTKVNGTCEPVGVATDIYDCVSFNIC